MNNKIRVVILDDHQAIIDGYLYRLRNAPDIEVEAALLFGEELDAALAQHAADVLLLDLQVPISSDNPNPFPILHELPRLLEAYPKLDVLVVTMHAQPALIQAVMEAGASGYILKDDVSSFRDLASVIRSVASQGIYLSPAAYQALNARRVHESAKLLSPRQLEAISLCAAYPGASTAELATMMEISHSTFRNLLSGAYIKFGVPNRISAVFKAQQTGLIPPGSTGVIS